MGTQFSSSVGSGVRSSIANSYSGMGRLSFGSSKKRTAEFVSRAGPIIQFFQQQGHFVNLRSSPAFKKSLGSLARLAAFASRQQLESLSEEYGFSEGGNILSKIVRSIKAEIHEVAPPENGNDKFRVAAEVALAGVFNWLASEDQETLTSMRALESALEKAHLRGLIEKYINFYIQEILHTVVSLGKDGMKERDVEESKRSAGVVARSIARGTVEEIVRRGSMNSASAVAKIVGEKLEEALGRGLDSES